MNDIVDAEFVESAPLAVRETQQAPALFGTTDPVESVTKMVAVADALKSILVGKKLISNIQGREYVQVEGWQVLAGMLRVSAIVEWTRKLEGGGWECRCVVRDPMGNLIGAGEGQCSRDERTWAKREDYALRAMAQTRATSRALRNVLGFIVTLAGFQATPADEMPRDTDAAPPRKPEPRVTQIDGASQPQKKMIFALCNELHFEQADRHKVLDGLTGKRSLNDVTRDEATKVISYLNDLIRDSAPPLEGVT